MLQVFTAKLGYILAGTHRIFVFNLGGYMAKFIDKCPKCLGTDTYFAKKQITTGIVAGWGGKQIDIQAPYCKKCDIEANRIPLDKNGNEVSPEFSWKKGGWGCAVLVLIMILNIIFIPMILSN
jgi:hypothetical protein